MRVQLQQNRTGNLPFGDEWGMTCEFGTHKCKGAKYPSCQDSDTCYITSPQNMGKKFRGRCGNGWFVTFLPVNDNGDVEMNGV